MIAVNVMQMAVVQIVRVRVVLERGMPTIVPVYVGVALVRFVHTRSIPRGPGAPLGQDGLLA